MDAPSPRIGAGYGLYRYGYAADISRSLSTKRKLFIMDPVI